MSPAAINKLRRELCAYKLDALLVTRGANVSYLSGFRGEGQLLISSAKKVLIVDFRFKEQAEKEAGSFQIRARESFRPLEEDVASLVKKMKLKRVGFEDTSLSYKGYRRLEKALKPVKFLPTANIVDYIRAVKSPEEIKVLRKAAALAVKSFSFARKIIKPGIREQEAAGEIQYFMRKSGAEDCSFDSIVASGKHASEPHALAGPKIIRNNEAVMVDLGCRVSGYNSDLTRMVFLGKIKARMKCVYEVVYQAQQLAIKAVRAGERISRIDRIARNYICDMGFGEFFGHALGHGIGKEVHEYPSLSPKNHDVLKEGMVFTVEPGIYIPGWGGVRIEDMVLVTDRGCEVLTK
jgi:Xaa-Pro aminopeptidase